MARRSSAKRSAKLMIKKSAQKRYYYKGSRSDRRVVQLGKRTCSSQSRKVYVGKRGGRYCLRNGEKRYLPK